MITDGDREWIKANRKEITKGRTESVIIVHETDGDPDPYTGEPAKVTTQESVDVVWREFSTFGNLDYALVGGIEILIDDVKVTFDPEVNISDVSKIIRKGKSYAILASDERGVAGVNRRECIVRSIG